MSGGLCFVSATGVSCLWYLNPFSSAVLSRLTAVILLFFNNKLNLHVFYSLLKHISIVKYTIIGSYLL